MTANSKRPQWMTDPIIIQPGALRMSAEAMRSLRKATGRSLTELLQDDEDEANRFQALAFAQIFRRGAALGHLPDAGTLWEAAGLVEVEFATEGLDPLGGVSSITSPPSADTGE